MSWGSWISSSISSIVSTATTAITRPISGVVNWLFGVDHMRATRESSGQFQRREIRRIGDFVENDNAFERARIAEDIEVNDFTTETPNEGVVYVTTEGINRARADNNFTGFSEFVEVIGDINYDDPELLKIARIANESDLNISITVYQQDDEIDEDYLIDRQNRLRYRTFIIDGEERIYFLSSGFTLSRETILNRSRQAGSSSSRAMRFSDWEGDVSTPYLLQIRVYVPRYLRNKRNQMGRMFMSLALNNDIIDKTVDFLQEEFHEDLTRYQIFSEGVVMYEVSNQSHCLLHSLEKAGLHVTNGDLAKLGIAYDHGINLSGLKALAEVKECVIVLHRLENDLVYKKKRTTFGRVSDAVNGVYEICLYKEHYFVFDEFEVYSEELGLKVGGRNNKIKNSLYLIYALDQAGCFKPLPDNWIINLFDNFNQDPSKNFKDPTKMVSPFEKSDRKQHYVIEIDADFETFPAVGTSHIPYLLGYVENNDFRYLMGKSIGRKFLNNLNRRAEEEYNRILSYSNYAGNLDSLEGSHNEKELEQVIKFNLPPELTHLNELFPPDLTLRDMTYRKWFRRSLPVKVYFHNLRYDISFITEHLTSIRSYMGDVSSVKRVCGYFYKQPYVFQDNYALIPMSIEKIPASLGLDFLKKGVLPYKLYSPDNIWRNNVFLSDAIKHVPDDKIDIFLKEAREGGYITMKGDNEVFNHIKYCIYYCEYDLRIQRDGRLKLMSSISKALNNDMNDPITVSGISQKLQEDYGVFDDVYYLEGELSEKIRRNMCHGGRTDLSFGLKQNVKGRFVYYDAVSLYPSAQLRMGGYLKGKPKLIPTKWFDDEARRGGYPQLSSMTMEEGGFFVTIHLKRIPRKRAFSIYYNSSQGVRDYSCDIPKGGVIWHLNIIDWEMYTKFFKCKPGIDFTVTSGVYFNEGRNMKLREFTNDLFNLRLHYKKLLKSEDPDERKQGSVQEVIKLILNSTYGKTIMRPFNCDVTIVNQMELDQALETLGHHVLEYKPITAEKFLIYHTSVPKYKSRAHCGSEVLSMSKLIMCEVMCLAEDLGIEVYYTDTDSFIIDESGMTELKQEFERIYGRPLDGKMLGEFHSDFPDQIGVDESKAVYADHLIAVGKKCYYMSVNYPMADGTNKQVDLMKVKGFPKKCVEKYAKNNFSGGVRELYEDLCEEGIHRIEMIYDQHTACFEFNKSMGVTSRKQYHRTLKFLSPEVEKAFKDLSKNKCGSLDILA